MEEERIYSYDKSEAKVLSRTFMSSVFAWMFAALAITAVTAYLTATSETLLRMLLNENGLTTFGWVVMLAPVGLVLLMSLGYKKLPSPTLTFLLVLYSVLMGMSLSFILFLVYPQAVIFKTFAVTAGTFGAMAVVGYTTKTDLTKFGSILYMALIGLILAMLVNFFMKSARMDYIISIIGVLLFTGLTAYDVQKLKRIGTVVEQGTEGFRKMAIMGALSLYLDFINLFLFLLRIFGRK